jgi:hypothetical protein
LLFPNDTLMATNAQLDGSCVLGSHNRSQVDPR